MTRGSECANLDLLRSVAVIDIVAFHVLLFFKKTDLGLFWPIGHWGVQLFFVHTCLVLMFSLERHEGREHGAKFFWQFYLRRCFRLYPLSIFVVAVLALFGWPVGHLYLGKFTAVHLGARGLLSNYLLIQNMTKADSITAPLWSLPLEPEMYVFLPLLFLLARGSRTIFPILGVWMLSVVGGLEAIKHYHPNIWAFDMAVPCFIAGVVSYKVSKLVKIRVPFFVFPVVLTALTYFYLRVPKPSRAWVWCLTLGLALPLFKEMSASWLNHVCHYIARYSYGIYLTHFACIWFASVALARFPLAARWVIFFAVASAIPIILYHTIEAPMIALGRRSIPARKVEPTPDLAVPAL